MAPIAYCVEVAEVEAVLQAGDKGGFGHVTQPENLSVSGIR